MKTALTLLAAMLLALVASVLPRGRGRASDKSFFNGAPHPVSPSFRNAVSLDQLGFSRFAGVHRRHR